MADIPTLTSLSINLNNPKRITELSGVTSLVELKISGKEIADLSPLRGMTKLQNLNISGSSATNLNALANLRELKHLKLSNCERISDISGLRNMTNLETLDLNGCIALVDLSPLQKLPKLKTLNVERAKVSLDGLTNQPSLESIRMFVWQGSDLQPLGTIPTMRTVVIKNSVHVTSAAPLSNLKKLEKLDMRDCAKLQDVSGLGSLPALTQVSFTGCRALEDISGLQGAPALETLSLMGCAVVDASPLVDCPALTKIELRHIYKGKHPFKDVTPFMKMPQLDHLTLTGTKVTPKKAITLSKTLIHTTIHYGGVSSKQVIPGEPRPLMAHTLATRRPQWKLNSNGKSIKRTIKLSDLHQAARILKLIADALTPEDSVPKISISTSGMAMTFSTDDENGLDPATFELIEKIDNVT